MNNSQFARGHLFPTAKGDVIRIKCNCGRIDTVKVRDFIGTCKHVCSAGHTKGSWFSGVVEFEPYNAYWCILKYSRGANPRWNLEQRLHKVMRQVERAEQNGCT